MTDVRPAFVFLREDGETNNEAVARCAAEVLAPGAMGNSIRSDDYASFLEGAFGVGKGLIHIATSCAMFAGGVCIHAGAQDKRKPPKAPAITTWLGVRGFVEDDEDTDLIEGSWVPLAELGEAGPLRGDIVYICSSHGTLGGRTWTRWQDALNGHVIVLVEGSGWLWTTAEGGGVPNGTGCRLSAEPKDILRLSRPPRGVWRPNLMRVAS